MKSSTTPPAGKPVIQGFDLSPDTISRQLGQSSTLHWNVHDAYTIYISNVGFGSMAITPAKSGRYTLTATNPNGSVSVSRTLTVKP